MIEISKKSGRSLVGAVWLVVGLTLPATVVGCQLDDTGRRDGTDGGGSSVDGGGGGGGTDAGAPSHDDAGATSADGGTTSACAPAHLLVTTSDFATGGLATSALDLTGVRTATAPLSDQDTAAVRLGCRAALLEHGTGHLRLQSSADGLVTTRTIDLNPPSVADPYAVNPSAALALDGDRALVASLSRSELIVVDVAEGGASAPLSRIDLTAFAAPGDTDSVDATDLVRAGSEIYVALGRYFFAGASPSFPAGSVLAVLDASTLALRSAPVVLTGNNPRAGMYYDAANRRLLVADTGAYGVMDGGIEVVSLDSHTTTGFILTEAELGGDLEQLVVADATHAFIMSGGRVRAWNPTTHALGATLVDAATTLLSLHDGTLYVVAAMGTTAGVRAFRVSDNVETTPSGRPVAFGALPVYTLAVAP